MAEIYALAEMAYPELMYMEIKIYYFEKCDNIRFVRKTYTVRRCGVCGGELEKTYFYFRETEEVSA